MLTEEEIDAIVSYEETCLFWIVEAGFKKIVEDIFNRLRKQFDGISVLDKEQIKRESVYYLMDKMHRYKDGNRDRMTAYFATIAKGKMIYLWYHIKRRKKD